MVNVAVVVVFVVGVVIVAVVVVDVVVGYTAPHAPASSISKVRLLHRGSSIGMPSGPRGPIVGRGGRSKSESGK